MNTNVFQALYRYTKALSAALGHRDTLTRMHSERVTALSLGLGEHCGLTVDELDTLRVAAVFHDIGKIGVPDAVLLKPGRLDPVEWQCMQRHSEIGQQILLATELDGAEATAKVVRHHHEHFDGSGYPDRISGEQIPIAARIIAITDSYDAMAVTRSYHAAKGHAVIAGTLRAESGTKYDPELSRMFLQYIETSPLRTRLA
ncbi:HD-GYP domain-containing protein [Rhodoferax sp.]|uniref:HD-GYP domain-containing protein n=1 Tax=Rhodoferax sp. TaxID=50421 RepID=UPI00277AFF39|nr:HD domain-containing protein [Rhodoferax sp.]